MKILVSTTWAENFNELCEMVHQQNLKYFRRWGYEYNVHYCDHKSESVYYNSFIRFALMMLPYYDIVVTTDADWLIMDHTVRLEDIFNEEAGMEYRQVIAEENVNSMCSLINAGMVMWGRGESSENLLSSILREREYWEKADPRVWQQQIWELIKRSDVLVSKLKVGNPHRINAWSSQGYGCSYKPGDFAIHPYATKYEKKIEIIKEYIPKIKR